MIAHQLLDSGVMNIHLPAILMFFEVHESYQYLLITEYAGP